jgi:NAD+ diphosphatase
MKLSQIMPLPAILGFAHGSYDRAAHLREDADRLALLAKDKAARLLVLCGDVPVMHKTAGGIDPLFDMADYPGAGTAQEKIFLGFDNGAPRFAVAVDGSMADMLHTREDVKLIDTRSLAIQGVLAPEVMGGIATAKALFFWHRTHRFCSQCGKLSEMTKAGWQRNCPACGAQHFPRTDAVVIMLAVDGNTCLMGRQSRFPPGMYSCLAGFVEPGETMETAVRREVKEETGIDTGSVAYLFSQPWPFPESLMMGCIAEATSREIVVDTNELEDARWFARQDVLAMMEGNHPEGFACPPAMSIAHQIMRVWAAGEGK